MKFIYPAVIRQNNAGLFEAFFPDLEGCRAEGDTLEEAVDNANAAACDWILVELEDENGQLPPVSDASDLTLETGDTVRNIAVNIRFTDGWDE